MHTAIFMRTESYATASPIGDRKSTRLNSSHANISHAVFCLKKKNVSSKSLRLYGAALSYRLSIKAKHAAMSSLITRPCQTLPLACHRVLTHTDLLPSYSNID